MSVWNDDMDAAPKDGTKFLAWDAEGAIAIIWAFAVHSVWLSSAGLFVTAAALINEHFIGLSDVRVKSFNPLTIVFTWWR